MYLVKLIVKLLLLFINGDLVVIIFNVAAFGSGGDDHKLLLLSRRHRKTYLQPLRLSSLKQPSRSHLIETRNERGYLLTPTRYYDRPWFLLHALDSMFRAAGYEEALICLSSLITRRARADGSNKGDSFDLLFEYLKVPPLPPLPLSLSLSVIKFAFRDISDMDLSRFWIWKLQFPLSMSSMLLVLKERW